MKEKLDFSSGYLKRLQNLYHLRMSAEKAYSGRGTTNTNSGNTGELLDVKRRFGSKVRVQSS